MGFYRGVGLKRNSMLHRILMIQFVQRAVVSTALHMDAGCTNQSNNMCFLYPKVMMVFYMSHAGCHSEIVCPRTLCNGLRVQA